MTNLGRLKNLVPKGERKIRERFGRILHENVQREDAWWEGFIDGLLEKHGSERSDPINTCMELAWVMPFQEVEAAFHQALTRLELEKREAEARAFREAESRNAGPQVAAVRAKDLL